MDLNINKRSFLYDYAILFLILGLGLWAFLFLGFDQFLKTLVIFATSAAYVCWGILHHWLAGDLHIKVIIEYVLIACLATTILLALILWS